MPSTSNKSPKVIARAVGRRKSAVASVYLASGTGEVTVNGKPSHVYFPSPQAKLRLQQPFTAAAVIKYNASVKVHGGGQNGQLDAAVLGMSRALIIAKASFKPSLKSARLLTRDPRQRQRRMIGTGGKARRRKQSPKR